MRVQTKVTWLVVADGGQARIFVSHGKKDGLTKLDDSVADLEAGLPRGMADTRGRTFDSGGQGRHRLEGADPRAHAKTRFLADLADRLNKGALADRYDRLVLIAPPKALGELRGHLHKQAQNRLAVEQPSDLVHLNERDLAGQLRDLL